MIILTPLPSWSLFSCSSSTTPFVHPSPFIVHRLKSILLLLSENEQFVRRRTPPVYLFTSIRQTNCETGSLSFLRSNRDDSIQTSDDGLTNTQSQPGSLGKTVDFIETFEDMPQPILRNTFSGIFYKNRSISRLPPYNRM